MKEVYRLYFFVAFVFGFILEFNEAAAQCPTDRTLAPASATICSGSTVSITITSAENNIAYQLQNAADNSALSGFFLGNGGNLTVTSSALTSVRVRAVRL